MSNPSRPPEEALRGKAVSGAKWGALASLAAFIFSFGQNVALARMLTPNDFGLAGMIWAVLGLAQLLSDAGMTGILLYKQQAGKEQVSTVFWVNTAVSLLLSALLLAATPLLVWFNREPALAPFVPWAVISFFLSCLGSPLRTLAQRDLHFDGLAVSESAAGGAALVAAIAVAFRGGGVYALLAAGIVSAAVRLLIVCFILRRDFPVGFLFNMAHVRTMAGFGLYQLGDRIANYLWSNLDYLLVGRFLGAGPLGYYRMAYETAVRPLSVVNPIFNSVAYPLFARKQQDPEAMRRGYLDMIALLAALVTPLLAGLAALSGLTLEVVFGSQWAASGPALQILCILGVLRCLQNPIGALVIASGKPAIGFAYNAVLLVLNLVFFPIALQYGIEALAWAAVATTALSIAGTWRIVYGETISLPAPAWLARLAAPVSISLAMAAAVWLLERSLPPGLPPALRLVVSIASGAVFYLGVYWRTNPEFIRSFVAMLRNR